MPHILWNLSGCHIVLKELIKEPDERYFFPITIGRYFLDNEGKNITDAIALASGDPLFVIPTTGVICERRFLFYGQWKRRVN